MVFSYFSSEKPLIVITGVTGFIGSALLNHCLSTPEISDNYKIRGTARNPDEYDRMEPLYSFFDGEESFKSKCDIVHADLSDAASIEKAIKGATYVLHTASPVGIQEPKNPDDMIKPAVEGTLAVMRAA